MEEYYGRGLQLLDAIFTHRTIRNLGILMDGWTEDREHRMAAYNMSNLLNLRGEKLTVEFRQHAGCSDGERVRFWAKFCILLLDFGPRESIAAV